MIVFSNIQSDALFEITLADFAFSNIKFSRGGDILKFQHQTNEVLTMSNISFSRIFYGGISIESADKTAGASKTKVNIYNLTAQNIDAQFRSFIQINEGALLQIHTSSFSKVSNLMGGAVLKAGYQRAEALVYSTVFTNNTSTEGAVFVTESESTIKCYNCTMSHNFAIGSSVVKAIDDGSFILDN